MANLFRWQTYLGGKLGQGLGNLAQRIPIGKLAEKIGCFVAGTEVLKYFSYQTPDNHFCAAHIQGIRRNHLGNNTEFEWQDEVENQFEPKAVFDVCFLSDSPNWWTGGHCCRESSR